MPAASFSCPTVCGRAVSAAHKNAHPKERSPKQQHGRRKRNGRDWREFAKPNLRYVRQPNGTCERYARDQFTARGGKREEVLSASTERKWKGKLGARLVERVNGGSTIGSGIEVENGLSKEKARNYCL